MLARRHFLRASTSLLAFPTLHSLAYETARATDGRMVLIFLRGGLDGLFAFAPVDDPQLAELRPTLSRAVLAQGIRLGQTGFAAHPACQSLAALFEAGELAFAPCAGTTDTSRSHFQAQDLFELGSGRIHGDSGFMARAARALGARAGAISFTQEVPLCFQGTDTAVEVAPLRGSGLKLPPGRLLDAVRVAHRGMDTGEALEQAIATQAEIETAAGMEPNAARGAPSVNGFAKESAQMGRILRSNPRLTLAFMDVGGWDTHAQEEGVLVRALESLSTGIAALKDALGPNEWRSTHVAVMSEFGRTVRENGTHGTDHGHGGLYLLAGGAMDGRRMIGDFRSLSDRDLSQNRDLPALADWRALLGNSLKQTHSLQGAALREIFPGLPKQSL